MDQKAEKKPDGTDGTGLEPVIPEPVLGSEGEGDNLLPDFNTDEEEDGEALEHLKRRRVGRLKAIAFLLVLAMVTAAAVGIFSGGGIGRWLRGVIQPKGQMSESYQQPTWNLSDLYASLEDARDALGAVKLETGHYLSKGESVTSGDLERIQRTSERLLVYATLLRDSDLSDSDAKAFKAAADALVRQVMRLEDADHPGGGGDLSFYELSGHYEDIYSSFIFQYGIEFGSQPGMYSSNSDQRYQAFQAWIGDIKPSAEVLADIFEGKVKYDNYLARMYGDQDALETFLRMDGFNRTEFERLRRTTHLNLALNHRWIALKGQLVGVQKQMRFSDLYQPLPQVYEDLQVDQARAIIESALKPLPEDGIRVVRRAFEEAWIDYGPRENKYDGAYTYGSYEVHPYLLLNFDGSASGVAVMAHEMGHAVHLVLSAESQSFNTYYADVMMSELAATVTEVLCHEEVLKRANTRKQKIAALAGYLDFMSTTFFDQMLATEFEIEAHQMAEDGMDLSAVSLQASWSRLMSQYLGPAYEVTALDGYDWMLYPHLYWNFYMYKYATGAAAGYPLAIGLIQGDTAAVSLWLELMRAGGSKTGPELLLDADMNFDSEEIYKSFFERWEELLTELELLMNASPA